MGAAAIPMMVGGSLLDGYGRYQEGQANSRLADMNAAQAEENARLTIDQAHKDEIRLRVQGRKVLGDMRAAYAASGVTMDGSALDVLYDSAANIEMDALNIRHQGEMKARGYDVESQMEGMRSDGMRAGGGFGMAAGMLKAGGYAASYVPGAKSIASTGGGFKDIPNGLLKDYPWLKG